MLNCILLERSVHNWTVLKFPDMSVCSNRPGVLSPSCRSCPYITTQGIEVAGSTLVLVPAACGGGRAPVALQVSLSGIDGNDVLVFAVTGQAPPAPFTVSGVPSETYVQC